MGGRIAVPAVLGLLAFTPAAQAEDFSLTHSHSGAVDASAQGSVTFPATTGGASVSITVTDRNEDGWCAQAWVKSNLAPATHTTHQVCGVAKQQTWNLDLPAGERCNIAFVEVIVGRVDPSNGNQTELGQTKRMANPCPPLPDPTPPPPPEKIESPVTVEWFMKARRWRNKTFLVRDVPAGATVELRCSHCKTRAVPVRNGRANAHRMLRNRRLRPGTRLEVRITAPGMVGKVLRFKVRRRAIPSMTRYCLPPGGSSPQRC
jgi:hypothetical protein